MSKTRLILIIVAVVIFFAALGVYFTVSDNTQDQNNLLPTQQNPDFVSEDVVKEDTGVNDFETFGATKLKIVTYGGVSDIKTALSGQREFALIRNPRNTGDLEFHKSDSFGEYYFAENINGEKIEYTEGTPEGIFGIGDKGEVSGILISDRNTSTEYYASYPIQELAKKYGFIAVRDDPITNSFLKNKYLKIKNLNNNRQVVVEIDSRNPIEDTLYVSEATRKALMIDENALGSFSLEIVDKENNKLGVVRL